jgi:outer membrane protein assembly factor BamB
MRVRKPIAAAVGGVTAVLLLLAPGAGTAPRPPIDWPTYGYDLQRTGYNPAERAIGTANAATLHQAWSRDLGAVLNTQPIVAAGVNVAGTPRDLVYAGSEHALLAAIDLHTGSVVWTRQLKSLQTTCQNWPDMVFGITGAPVIDRAAGVVYVVDGKAKLYALDLATGRTKPGWPIALSRRPTHEHVWSALTKSGNTIYAEFASYCGIEPYRGHIVAVDVTSHSVSAAFYTLGKRGPSGGAMWAWGGPSIDPRDGSVYLTTGNGIGAGEALPYAENVIKFDAGLQLVAAHHPELQGTDVDFGSTPTLFQAPGCPPQLAVENKNGALFLYDRDAISSGPVQRLQVADIAFWQFVGMPAWSPVTQNLYVANPTDSSEGTYRHGLLAFHIGSNCTMSLAWQSTIGPVRTVLSTPTVANGVVYYGDGNGNQVHALDAATGGQLWNATLGGHVFAAPTVVDGTVLVSSWDGSVHAYVPS